MSNVLVVLTQPNLNQLVVTESISATLVLATFGCEISVLLKDAGLSLLHSHVAFDHLKQAFKPASKLVESFEFYDIAPIYIQNEDKHSDFVTRSSQELAFVNFNSSFIQSFDHVIYW